MKKVWGALVATLALCAAVASPAIATELDNTNNTGNTEVDAKILDAAGEVAYIVTVPEKIDFGKLSVPDNDAEGVDAYAIQQFQVKCVEMQGVSLVKVHVYSFGSLAGEQNQKFFLTNKTNTACTFKPEYDVYAETTKIDVSEAMPANGFNYAMFSREGVSVTGGVALNQRQLLPYKDDLTPIAGEYTGTMVFTTSAA